MLEVQRSQKSSNHILHEETSPSNNRNLKDTDDESGQGDSLQHEKHPKHIVKATSHTPTDFSEAETSSSGFADETSNKATQTDGRPGAFLCTIADGEDCQFSIYDDTTSPVHSRFQSKPEYKELFSEIFTVLKQAAKNEDQGEQLPLLDETSKQPPPVEMNQTPNPADFVDYPDSITDDTQSIISSVMSEVSTVPDMIPPQTDREDETLFVEAEQKKTPETKTEERILKPYIRQPLDLEYISVGVKVRKRSSSRKKKQLADRSDSPITPILGSPKITYSNRPSARRRKDLRNNLIEQQPGWNGNTLHFYARNMPSPTPSQSSGKGGRYDNFECKPSTASQDLLKLKRLEMSYADVVRNAEMNKKKAQREAASKHHHQRRRQ